MADKMAELKEALEGLPVESLRLVAEFTEFLKRMQDKKEALQSDAD